MKFDHIGIAVENIEEYIRSFLNPVFGMVDVSNIVSDPLQKSRVAFVKLKPNLKIELIEPVGMSPVSSIVKRKHGGIYHLCFRADDFTKDFERLISHSFICVSEPKPAKAFNGRRVAFFFTPTRELIELLEP